MNHDIVSRDDRGEGVAVLSLDNPANGNALSTVMFASLIARLDDCLLDESVRVIIVKGNGRGFSSGADLSGYNPKQRGAYADRLSLLERHIDNCMRLWESPKPVVAQIHGYCFGMASLLGSCVDLVYIAENATVAWPLPLGGGMVGPQWVFHVGARRAKECSLVPASRISGTEAAVMGWANRALPEAELEDYVFDVAARMALVPAQLLRLKKEAINSVYDRMGFRDVLRQAASWNALAHTISEIDEVAELMRDQGIKAAQRYYRRLGPVLDAAPDATRSMS